MNIIGCISDSHGDIIGTRKAIESLHELGASQFIHLGDIRSIKVLEEFIGYKTNIVLGNCDNKDLIDHSIRLGLIPHNYFGIINFKNYLFGITHGHLGFSNNEFTKKKYLQFFTVILTYTETKLLME